MVSGSMRINLSPVGLAGCFADWMLTRQWKKVALYFLPLIIAGSTVGLVVAGSWLDRNKLATKYIKLADAEVMNGRSNGLRPRKPLRPRNHL